MSLKLIFLCSVSATVLLASDAVKPQGCVVPETGPQKGLVPQGCSSTGNIDIELLGGESQIRCKILDVKCFPGKKGEYLAVAKVEQWLRGTGPQKIEFRFKKDQKKLGRGLSADLTLEKKNSDWFLTKIDNATSSCDSLPFCR